MTLSFREQSLFTSVRENLFGDDESYARFQNALMENPRKGDVIQGGGGIRKVRWSDPKRGRGQRGGIRIIYLYVEEYDTILFLYAYNKNTSDITPQQKQLFALIAKEFRDQLEAGG